jgi:hypothetical protein
MDRDVDRRLQLHVRRLVCTYVSFPTVDQVNHEMSLIGGERFTQIGLSRSREPLRMLRLGAGPLKILVLGGPHPDAPVGFHTVPALAGLVSEVPSLVEEYTWYFVPVWDPDGARRNTWYTGPLEVGRYYRGMLRPAVDGQPSYMFPIDGVFDASIRETLAVKRVIDEVEPDLVLVYYNGEFGDGAWFWLNRRAEGLGAKLRAVADLSGLSMDLVTDEFVGWETDGPGVYVEPWTGAFEEVTAVPHGASLNEYLARRALSMAPEPAQWLIRVPQPSEGAAAGLAKLAVEAGAGVRALTDHLASVSGALSAQTPFTGGAALQINWGRSIAAKAGSWPGEPTATDYASQTRALHMSRLRAAGMLLQAFEAAIAEDPTPSILSAHTDLEGLFETWCVAFERLRPRAVPIDELVLTQARASLVVADHLRMMN